MNVLPYFMYFLVTQDISKKLDTCENVTTGATGFCLPEEFCTGTAKGDNIGPCGNAEAAAICCRIAYNLNGTTFTITKIPLPGDDGIEKHTRKVPHTNGTATHPGIRRYVDRHITDKMRRFTDIFRKVSNLRTLPVRTNASGEAGMIPNGGVLVRANPKSTHRNRKSMDIDAIPIERDSIENYSIDELESAMRDLTHNIMMPVQTEKTYDMREPVEIDPTHDMRKPVEIDSTHYRRISIEIDPTHDMRKPVDTDQEHSMRRVVQTDESHDLRWPVKEEETHDLRNPSHEVQMDIFRKFIVTEMVRFMSAYKKIEALSKILKNNTYSSVHITEDYIKCVTNYSETNVNSVNYVPFQHDGSEVKWNFMDVSRNATSACGQPYNQPNMKTNSSKNKWPWMVSLQEYFYNGYWHKCGASLLNNLWVITAAHCVDHQQKGEFLLRLGSETTELVPQLTVDRSLERIVIHPMYNRATLEHDVALIRMESPVQFQPNISPICLHTGVEEVDNNNAVALGWGLFSSEKPVFNYSMLELPVTLLKDPECDAYLMKENLGNTFVCAKVEEPYALCDGDSGGPLAILNNEGKWSLLGIVSWSHTCWPSPFKQPRVYTKISEYAQWIDDMMFCFEKLT